MSCKDIPIDIYNSKIGDDPHIVVPVEYLINEKKVEENGVRFKIEERDERLKLKGVVVVKKGRNGESEKKSDQNAIDNEKGMSVRDEKKLLPFPKVLPEKNLIEIVHGTTVDIYENEYMFFGKECKF